MWLYGVVTCTGSVILLVMFSVFALINNESLYFPVTKFCSLSITAQNYSLSEFIQILILKF